MSSMKTLMPIVAILFLAGCGSSSSNGDHPDGSGQDGSGQTDSSRDDARPDDGGKHHDGSHEGGGGDGSTDGSSDGPVMGGEAGTAVQCFQTFGSGGSELCGYSSSTMPGYKCPGGFSPGTCPSSGLFGCCVDTSMDAGVTAVGAVCYYSADAGTTAMGVCSSKPGEVWTTTSP
jgi:hypothetical protein